MSARPDVVLDVRETSHMSAGMIAYVRALRRHLPAVAPDLRVVCAGGGDNFDLAEQAVLPFAARRARLVHVPTPFVPLAYALGGRVVVTVHDLIDLHHPAYAKAKVGPYYRYAVAPVLRRAAAVLTDDEATVDDLERFLGIDRARVHVVPLGYDLPQPLPGPVAHPRPYLLYVGNRRPHKDLPTLARAWAALPQDLTVDLVLSGRGEVPEERRERGAIVELGDRDDTQLAGWYRGAAAYVHPALREGFGLPMLEAMRLGTPVVATHGALPRVLAPYARAFPAGDAAALAAHVHALLADRAAARAAAETARAATAHLDWAETARRTAAIYRAVLR